MNPISSYLSNMLVLTRPINVLYGECFNDSVAINDFHWFNDFFHNLLMITWYTAAVYQIWYPAAVYQISGRIWDILVCCTIPISLNEPYKKWYYPCACINAGNVSKYRLWQIKLIFHENYLYFNTCHVKLSNINIFFHILKCF